MVGLIVGDVGVPPEFQINGFFGAAAVLTTSERSNLAFFFFEVKVEDFMVDDVRVGIVLKAGGSTYGKVCAKCDSTQYGGIHAISSRLFCLEPVDVFCRHHLV